MVKRQQTEEPGDREPLDPDQEAQAAILEAIGQAGGETGAYSVFVFRLAGPNKKPDGREARLFQCGVGDLDGIADRLAHDFGEGIYRIRVRKDGRQFGRYWDTEIELSPSDRQAFAARNRQSLAPVMETPPAAHAQPATAAGGDLSTVLLAMMNQQTELIKTLVTVGRPAAPVAAPDPLETFTRTAAAFKGFTDLMPKSEAQTGLTMFEKGMQFAEKFMDRGGGGGGEKTSLVGLVRELVSNPELVKTVREAMARPAVITAQPARVAAPPAEGPAPAPQAGPMLQNQNQAIDYLIGQAKAGMQPELAADTALRLVPEKVLENLDALMDNMGAAAALDALVAQYPGMGEHRPWFAALLGAMYAEQPEQEGPAADGETEPSGDAGALPDVPAA